jgi:hypothetical protein
MNTLARLVGVAVVVEAVAAMVAPAALLAAGAVFITPRGLIAAAVIRVVIGGVLLSAAGRSRFPRALQVLGGIVIIAGLMTPLFGVDRAQAVVQWFASRGAIAMRVVGAGMMLLGAFLFYAAGPRGGADRYGKE